MSGSYAKLLRMTTAYHSDELSAGHTAARTVAAGLAGGVLALAAWFVLHRIALPAFNTSMVTRSLATAASVSYTHPEPTRLLSISYAVFCLKKN